jgi:hypothetical protein
MGPLFTWSQNLSGLIAIVLKTASIVFPPGMALFYYMRLKPIFSEEEYKREWEVDLISEAFKKWGSKEKYKARYMTEKQLE